MWVRGPFLVGKTRSLHSGEDSAASTDILDNIKENWRGARTGRGRGRAEGGQLAVAARVSSVQEKLVSSNLAQSSSVDAKLLSDEEAGLNEAFVVAPVEAVEPPPAAK